jgi:hypothetical protein
MSYDTTTYYVYYVPIDVRHKNNSRVEWRSGLPIATRSARRVYRTLRKGGMYTWEARLAIIDLLNASVEMIQSNKGETK